MLASGADDSTVCLWDLFTPGNGAVLDGHAATTDTLSSNNGAPSNHPLPSTNSHTPAQPAASGSGSASGGNTAQTPNTKGPAASWRCDYEVANLSWAPQSSMMGQGGEWLGVTGGRGIWGVKL